MIIIYILIGFFLNLILAAIVFSLIDINKELYNWIFNDIPKIDDVLGSVIIWFLQLLVITLWPITAYIYLTRK